MLYPNSSPKAILLLLGLVMGSLQGFSQADRDPRNELIERWIRDAVEYGSTPERRERKAEARQQLRSYGASGFGWLMERIHVERVSLRVFAQEWVLELEPQEAVGVLSRFLHHAEPTTRRLALYFLGFLKAPTPAPSLVPFLLDKATRVAAIRTLGKWKREEKVPYLVAFLRDEDERVRIAAANALRELQMPSSIPALIEALSDPVFTVRSTAQRALEACGTPATDALMGKLAELEGTALRHAIRTLGAQRAGQAAKELTYLLNHPAWGVRGDAAQALARMPLDNLAETFETLRAKESDPYVRFSLRPPLVRPRP